MSRYKMEPKDMVTDVGLQRPHVSRGWQRSSQELIKINSSLIQWLVT